jgi:CRP/FNR family transcriptional regulator, cyclic AMP receptor protein
MTIGYALGFIGAALMVASYLMKSMLPLRLTALVACIFFFAYGWITWAVPSLVLYGLLIPINIKKALHVHHLIKAIERARADTPLAEWLLPHMTQRRATAGTVLWHKGDAATEMVYVEHGMIRLVEHDKLLGPGTLVGEIGLLSPDNRRTLTITCETDCVLHSLSADGMAQLYYTNPKLGFHVMRMVVQRLLHDAEKARLAAAAAAERQLAHEREAVQPIAQPGAEPSPGQSAG